MRFPMMLAPSLLRLWARRHHPWVLLWPLAITQVTSWGTLYYSFPLLSAPMRAELGWSQSLLSGAITAGLLITGLAAYPVGALLDRHGGRALMTFGSVGSGLMLALWSQVTLPWQFYALWMVLGVFLACCLIEPLFAVINQVFGSQARAGLTAATLVTGLSGTIYVPLLGALLQSIDWRTALLVMAALNLGLNAPLHWLFVPARASVAQNTHPLTRRRGSVVMRRRLRNPVFWGLALWYTSYSLTASSLIFQYVPVLRGEGVKEAVILFTFALIGPVQVLARIVMVTLGRDLSIARLGAFTSSLAPLAVLLLIFEPHDFFWLCVFVSCFATSHGITTILRGTAPAEWLGRDHLARTMGAIAFPMMVAMALAPSLTAWAWDATGSSRFMLWMVFAGALLGTFGYWLAVLARRSARRRS